MRSLPRIAALAGVMLAGATALGQGIEIATIGKQPLELFEFRDPQTNEVKFSLSRFRGRILVFYFWRTGSTECVSLFPELNALNNKYRAQGVRFVSLCPEEEERYKKFLEGSQLELFAGGESYNLYGPYGRVVQQHFGALAQPGIAIIDPYGAVVWRGSPLDRLEERIQETIAATPPIAGDTKLLDQLFRKAEKFQDEKELGKAFTLARYLFRVTDEENTLHGNAQTMMANLEQAAKDWLKEAIELERGGKLEEAARVVAQISVRFEDDERRADSNNNQNQNEEKEGASKDANNEIGRMNADRRLKQLIRTAMDDARGEMQNEHAELLEQLNRRQWALSLYKDVVEKYKDTNAAKTAKAAVERLTSDKKALAAIENEREEDFAHRWLDLGERFEKAQMPDQAREQYEKLLREYPQSDLAKTAKERLDKLPKPADPKGETEAKSDAASPKAAAAPGGGGTRAP